MSTVSIVVPNYNRATLLRETLDNLLSQTLPPYELIVVDDRSTDNFKDVVSDYKDRVIFTTNKGKGPGAGRNTGFDIATGKYVKYFDSDDVMTKNTLEVQTEILERTGAPMLYGPYVHVRKNEAKVWEQTDVIIQYNPFPSSLTLRQCMTRGFFTLIASMLFDREYIKQFGTWRTDITAYEDWDLLWRIAADNNNPLHSNLCCTFYRKHGEQITGHAFTNIMRDRDRLTCFSDCYKTIDVPATKVTDFDKLVMETQIWKSLGNLKNLPEYEEKYRLATNPSVKIMAQYLRISNKINRVITKSDWQVAHGINASPEAFNNYLKLIN